MPNELVARNGLIALNNSFVTGSLNVSNGINVTNGITGSLFGTSSWATQALTASSADNFSVRGTLTATTLVVQTITSSQNFITGSTRFGNDPTNNTHQFSGSVSITGSLSLNSGVGTINATSSWAARAVTSSIADNAVTASHALNAVTASRALNANTASFATSAANATTASFATSAATATAVVATVAGTTSTELVRGNMADNDQFRILVGGTATNAGYAEIATADDGTEPIHVRQYTGVFSSLTRTATLLDGSGNTSFPGTVSATFSGNLTGTASFATFATNALSASRALQANTASYATFAATATSATSAGSATSASYATFAATASSANDFTVRGTLTAADGLRSNRTQDALSGLFLRSTIDGSSITNNGIIIGKATSANNAASIVYTHSSDGSTSNRLGLGFWASDNLLNLTAGGNVGIGTTTATAPLTFNAAIGNKIDFYNDGIGNRYAAQINSGELRFYTSGSADVISLYAGNVIGLVNKNGNVGIGTTSPLYKLEVSGDKSRFYNVSIGGTVGGDYAAYSDSVVGTVGNLHLAATGSGAVYINTIIARPTYINPVGGNVGIGTTSSARTLDVAGEIRTRTGTIDFSNDTNNQIYVLSNTMTLKTNSSDRVTITSGGNVGIGTTSPASLLHVSKAGNSAGGTILMGIANDSTAKWSYLVSTQYNSSTHPQGFSVIGSYTSATANTVVIGGGIYEANPSTEIQFWTHTAVSHSTGGTQKMVINTNGSVGIGSATPAYTLDVNGTGRFSGTLRVETSSSPGVNIVKDASADNRYLRFTNSQASSKNWDIINQTNAGGNNFIIYNATDNLSALSITPTGATTAGGFLANGTATIGIPIDTGGSKAYFDASSINGPGLAIRADSIGRTIRLTSDGSGTQIGAIDINSTGLVIGTNTAHPITFNPNATERMRITSGGNVGIGSTSPAYKLYVDGDIATFAGEIITSRNITQYNSNYNRTTRDSVYINSRIGGRISNTNPQFIDGTTSGWNIYNNSGGSTLTHTIVSEGTINYIPNATGKALKISYNGGGSVSPGYGGFYFATSNSTSNGVIDGFNQYRQGQRIMVRIMANIPSGRSIYFASNAYGNGSFQEWITSQAGTGDWEEYVMVQQIGKGGSLSSTHFFYIDGGSNVAFDWYVAYAEAVDVDAPTDIRNSSALSIGYSTTYNSINAGYGGLGMLGNAIIGGNVGIGTTSLSSKLTVSDGSSYFYIRGNAAGDFQAPALAPHIATGDFTIYAGAIGSGTARMIVKNDGNVGIGTTSPGVKLQIQSGDLTLVSGVINIPSRINLTSAGANNAYINESWGINLIGVTTHPVQVRGASFSVGYDLGGGSSYGTNNAYIAGSVGIGTTSPINKLHVAGGKTLIISDDGSYGQFQINAPGGGEATMLLSSTGTGQNSGGYTNAGVIGLGAYGNARDLLVIGTGYSGGTMFLKGNEVGINTSAPYDNAQYSLDINGGLLIKNTGKTAQLVLQNADPAAGGNNGFIVHTAGGTTTGAFGALQTYYGTSVVAGTLRLQPSGGNVGIGTTSAGYKLDIAGDIRATGTLIISTGNTTGGGIVLADDGDIVDLNDGYCAMRFSSGVRVHAGNRTGAAVIKLGNGGDIIASADITAYGSPSDINLKENIKPLEGALEKVIKLQGVSFTWKEDTEMSKMINLKDDIGFIAQEVQEVVPDLVRKNDNGLLSLRDKGITALLVEAIKEQQKQIDELKYLLQNK